MAEALFLREGEAYVPTENASGPWSPDYLHGGPPTGLLAWALEQAAAGSGLRLARQTTDLLRPVPSKPLTVRVETVRTGRRLRVLQADLLADDVVVSRATALYLEQVPLDVPGHARFPDDALPAREGPAQTLIQVAERGREVPQLTLTGLHTTAEVHLIDGVQGRGVGRVWMRLPIPVVAGEECSTTVQAATLADFGNGIGQLHVADNVGSINADISLYLTRPPCGEWIGFDARARMGDNGNGLVETRLFDDKGGIGRVTQATLAMPVYGG